MPVGANLYHYYVCINVCRRGVKRSLVCACYYMVSASVSTMVMVVAAAAAQKMNNDGAWRRQQQAKPFSSVYFITCLFLIISIHTQFIYFCLFNKEISQQKRKRHEFRQNLSQLAGLWRQYQDFNSTLTKDWHISTFVSKQHFLEFDKKLTEFEKFLAEPTID